MDQFHRHALCPKGIDKSKKRRDGVTRLIQRVDHASQHNIEIRGKQYEEAINLDSRFRLLIGKLDETNCAPPLRSPVRMVHRRYTRGSPRGENLGALTANWLLP